MTGHRVPGARGVRRAVVALGTAAVLAACTAIPTSGPVEESDIEVTEPSEIDVLAEGPQPGDTPAEIVDGFLAAGAAGSTDNFATAREYLAGEARTSWDPSAGVLVSGPIEPAPATTETEVVMDVAVEARVGDKGVYVEVPPDSSESLTFGMVKNDADEWRIAEPPPGLILQEQDFERLYRPASLYFLSPDQTFLVPEERWYPTKNLSTSIVLGLLAGPSAWLQDAVVTAVPEGVQLSPAAVPVDEGVAEVRLEPALAVTRADRDLLIAQLDASLRPVPGISSVQVYARDVPLEGSATLQSGSGPPGNVEFLQDDRLVALVDGQVKPVPDVLPLDGLDPRSPARNEDGSVRVMLSGLGTLTTMPTTDAGPQELLSGSGLVAPSVDRFDWAWTAQSASGLLAARSGVPPVQVSADWLEGRAVRAVRVARDGVRIAVVSTGADGVHVDVAAITRDDSGAPVQLGSPIRAGASLVDATSVVWSEESTLAVVGRSVGNPAVHLVPVAGPTQDPLPEVANLADLAASTVIYVTTTDGELRRFVSTWAQILGVTGASYPSFPG